MTNGPYKARKLDMIFLPVDRKGKEPDLFVTKTGVSSLGQFFAIVKSEPVAETKVGKQYVEFEGMPGYHEITHMTLGPAKLHLK